jgi:hypothetical protein
MYGIPVLMSKHKQAPKYHLHLFLIGYLSLYFEVSVKHKLVGRDNKRARATNQEWFFLHPNNGARVKG